MAVLTPTRRSMPPQTRHVRSENRRNGLFRNGQCDSFENDRVAYRACVRRRAGLF